MRWIVIGGGIGGLAAGIALHRAGQDVRVFEQAPELREVGAGISLWPNAIHALDALGVGAIVRSQGVATALAAIRTAHGAPLMHTNATTMIERYGAPTVVLHRAALVQVLRDALPDGVLALGERCATLDIRADGIGVRFASGATAEGDVIVGADGIHSVVRAALHGAAPPRYAGYTAWRSVVPFDQASVLAGEFWGRGARFGQVPMANGQVYWFATCNAPANQHSPDGEQAALLRIFDGWHPSVGALIRATPPETILRNDIVDRPPLPVWGRDRATLLGDAAHAMTPNLGQGGCMALEDAVALGAIASAPDITAALRAYERTRIARTTPIVIQSRLMGQVGQWSNPLAVLARNAVFGLFAPRMQQRQFDALLRPPALPTV